MEVAFPGPLRDQLVAAILAGDKTTTSGLIADYEHAGNPLPHPGERHAVIDSHRHGLDTELIWLPGPARYVASRRIVRSGFPEKLSASGQPA
jgi:hypothetical protein